MISYQTEKQGGEGGLHLPKQQLEGPHIPPPPQKTTKINLASALHKTGLAE